MHFYFNSHSDKIPGQAECCFNKPQFSALLCKAIPKVLAPIGAEATSNYHAQLQAAGLFYRTIIADTDKIIMNGNRPPREFRRNFTLGAAENLFFAAIFSPTDDSRLVTHMHLVPRCARGVLSAALRRVASKRFAWLGAEGRPLIRAGTALGHLSREINAREWEASTAKLHSSPVRSSRRESHGQSMNFQGYASFRPPKESA